jgi:hypothetical protein
MQACIVHTCQFKKFSGLQAVLFDWGDFAKFQCEEKSDFNLYKGLFMKKRA